MRLSPQCNYGARVLTSYDNDRVTLYFWTRHYIFFVYVSKWPQCSETTPIGGQVAAGLLYWTACRLEWRDSDAVFITWNLEVGYNLICKRTLQKRTLVFLIHAHFAVTTVLSNGLTNHFFQQNKMAITFNKMITSGKSDWSYPPPKWAAC